MSVYICSCASSNVWGVGSTMFLFITSLTRESKLTWNEKENEIAQFEKKYFVAVHEHNSLTHRFGTQIQPKHRPIRNPRMDQSVSRLNL